jgi:hypothetical protein
MQCSYRRGDYTRIRKLRYANVPRRFRRFSQGLEEAPLQSGLSGGKTNVYRKKIPRKLVRATILLSAVSTVVCCLTLVTARRVLSQSACLSVSSSGPVWASSPFVSSQSGIFTAIADATPLSSGTDSAVGLSLGSQSTYTGLAAIARFNSAGYVDARNGSGYSSDATVQYTPGQVHHLRFEVNVVNHTYSV